MSLNGISGEETTILKHRQSGSNSARFTNMTMEQSEKPSEQYLSTNSTSKQSEVEFEEVNSLKQSEKEFVEIEMSIPISEGQSKPKSRCSEKSIDAENMTWNKAVEIEPIELKLAPAEQRNRLVDDDADDEDIGWFFDDGKVPPVPQLDEILLAAVSHLQLTEVKESFNITEKNTGETPLRVKQAGVKNHERSFGCRSINTKCNQIELDLELVNCKELQETRGFSNFPSCCVTNEKDDEFDSCFEPVATEVSHLGSDVPSCRVTGQAVDEFDDCFESSNNSVSKQNINSANSDHIFHKDYGGKIDRLNADKCKKSSCHGLTETSLMTNTDNQKLDINSVSKYQTNTRLTESNCVKLSSSEGSSPTSDNILLKANLSKSNGNHCAEEGSIAYKLESLMRKKELVKSKILNRSRHCGDIGGIVEELKQITSNSTSLGKNKAETVNEKKCTVTKHSKKSPDSSSLLQEHQESHSSLSQSSCSDDLQKKLKNILEKKKASIPTKILNSSRYFKTTQSSIATMSQEENSKSGQSISAITDNIEGNCTSELLPVLSDKCCDSDSGLKSNDTVKIDIKTVLTGLSHEREEFVECLYKLIETQMNFTSRLAVKDFR